MSNQTNQSSKTRYVVLLSMMAAIILVLGLVPNLGYIKVFALAITIVHIPVIIGAIVMGVKSGMALGFLFGLTSMLSATFIMPNPIESPIFSPFYTLGNFQGGIGSVIICFVPRILVGVVAWTVYKALSKTRISKSIYLAISGVAASLTNTLLVLGGILLFFAKPYSSAYGLTISGLYKAIAMVIVTNGLAEAVFAGILTVPVVLALQTLMKKNKI